MTDPDVPSANTLREFLTGQPVEPRPRIVEDEDPWLGRLATESLAEMDEADARPVPLDQVLAELPAPRCCDGACDF